MRSFLLRLILPTAVFTGLAWAQAPAALAPVIGVQNFIHSVENLDESVKFYRTVFGLELSGEIRPPNVNPAIPTLVNAKGAKFRAATFKLPGASFGLELTEFTGIPSKPAEPHHWDPGATDLVLHVRDVDAAFLALKKAGAQIISLPKEPVKIGAGGKIRSVMARDPDGYVLEAIQLDVPANAPAGLVVGAHMGLTVGDTEKTLAFYRDLLGFNIKVGEFSANKAILEMVGASAGQVKSNSGMVPGSDARIDFYEFKDIDRTPFRPRIPDPGSVALSLKVSNVNALLKTLKSAGIKVITVGGEPIPLGPSRNVFVEDPNGVAVELIQAAP